MSERKRKSPLASKNEAQLTGGTEKMAKSLMRRLGSKLMSDAESGKAPSIGDFVKLGEFLEEIKQSKKETGGKQQPKEITVRWVEAEKDEPVQA
jgi:hypothetical protein